jgi:serpin B
MFLSGTGWTVRSAVAVFLLILLPTTGTGKTTRLQQKPAPQPDLQMENATLKDTSGTTFALQLFNKLRSSGGNLFFSPSSIETALSMTMTGAGGLTEAQMASVMHIPVAGMQQHHETLASFENRLEKIGRKGNVTLASANSIWPQKDYRFSAAWQGQVKHYYGVSVTPVDYSGETEKARNTINRWVEKKTDDQIRELIKPGILNELTRLTLVNAVFFKGDWMSPFRKEKTEDAPFYLESGKNSTARLMHQSGTFGFADLDSLFLLQMPYTGNDLSMLVILPKKINGLSSIEAWLNPEQLNTWTTRIQETRIEAYLPKFQATSTFRLDKTLQSLGMIDAFKPELADFSRMVENNDRLFIGAVIHKAFVDVDEKGTEAAAATAVVMQLKSVMPAPVPVFRADHPFLYMIRENTTGRILFMGRISDPTLKGV